MMLDQQRCRAGIAGSLVATYQTYELLDTFLIMLDPAFFLDLVLWSAIPDVCGKY